MKTFQSFLLSIFVIVLSPLAAQDTASLTSGGLALRLDLMDQELRILRRENERLNNELRGYRLQNRVLEIQKDVAERRGLEIKSPLETRFFTREDIPRYIERELERQYPDGRFGHYQEALTRLGFLPYNTNLRETMHALYAEQVAGFYDDIEKEFFVLNTFDEKSIVSGIIIAHEICHALQDQNFDFEAMELFNTRNDDVNYAALSVLEGDATILMSEWLKDNFKLNMVFQLFSMLGIPQDAFNQAPYFLQKLLLFPYIQGMYFMMEVMAYEGLDARDAVFRNPPRSTEHILYPEKYLSGVDPPIDVVLPEGLSLPEGWRGEFENTFGLLGFKLLFEQYLPPFEAADAAEGWGGDRYALYRSQTGAYLILWDSFWDTALDADEAEKALAQVTNKRFPAAEPFSMDDDSPMQDVPDNAPDDALWKVVLSLAGKPAGGDEQPVFIRMQRGLRSVRYLLTSESELARSAFLSMPLQKSLDEIPHLPGGLLPGAAAREGDTLAP